MNAGSMTSCAKGRVGAKRAPKHRLPLPNRVRCIGLHRALDPIVEHHVLAFADTAFANRPLELLSWSRLPTLMVPLSTKSPHEGQ